MPVQKCCKLNLDSRRYELEPRGTPMFPVAGYFFDIYNGEMPWHWHEEIEVLIVRSGMMKLCINGEHHILRQNEGAFINANVLHSIQPVDDEDYAGDSLVFHSSLISGTAESVFERRYVRTLLNCCSIPAVIFNLDTEWRRQAIACINDAFEAYITEEYGYELAVRENLSRMWYLIVKNMNSLLSGQDAKENQDTIRMKVMIDFLHKQYAERLTVGKIAGAANISQRECLRCFQKSIGISPMQYLLKYRVSVSARLLLETSLTVAEICTQSGFENPSYFTKIFKRFMSCTPSAYRKSVR